MEKYKLLILDTLPNWREMFKEYLSEKYEVQTANNIEEAKNFMQQANFDLVIVGLASLNALHFADAVGQEFLSFLESEHSNIPRIIIDNDSNNDNTLTKGKFSRDELIEAVEDYILVKHPTGKEIVEFIKNDLIDAIEDAISKPKEVLRKKNKPTQTVQDRKIGVDFLIITTLRKEYSAVLSKFSNVRTIDKSQSVVNVLTTKKFTYHVVIVCVTHLKKKMGPVIAAIKTTAWLKDLQPKNILLVGIAGGVRDKSDLGDIIIPENIIDANVGKVVKGKEIPDYKHYEPTDILFNETDNTFLKNWSDHIEEKRPENGKSKIIRGLIISSGKVIADSKAVELYQETWRDMRGFEMEGAAVAAAIKDVGQQTEFLMIRAISDFGDENKESDKKWRPYAFDVAASYTRAFLESGPVLPLKPIFQ